jgi:uncharacterized membrane protein
VNSRASALLPGLLLVAFGLAGMAIAVYLTSVHYADTPLVCSSRGVVNCERVLSSGYSEVLGVPWSVGGIVWFAVLGVLGALALRAVEPVWLHPAQLVWALIGLATVFYLVGVEALALGVLCLWCTVEHLLIGAALITTLFRSPAPRPAGDMPPADTGQPAAGSSR